MNHFSAFIGAPKFGSFSGRYNTTGAVFSCTFENETCENFQIDNADIPGRTKDHQLLGFATDIIPNEKFIVSN